MSAMMGVRAGGTADVMEDIKSEPEDVKPDIEFLTVKLEPLDYRSGEDSCGPEPPSGSAASPAWSPSRPNSTPDGARLTPGVVHSTSPARTNTPVHSTVFSAVPEPGFSMTLPLKFTKSPPVRRNSKKKSGRQRTKHTKASAERKSSKVTYRCEECDETFRQRLFLDKHMIKIHDAPKQRYICECGAVFTAKGSLYMHMQRKHTGGTRASRRVPCEQCGKHVAAGHMKSHLLTHSGEKPFECGVCAKKFRDSSSFSRHKRLHTGEKPYSCGVCRQSFTDLSSLKYHSWKHTGERVACPHCSVSYAQDSNLRRHIMKTHALAGIQRPVNEGKLTCDKCGKMFTEGRNFRDHMRIHTGEKPHKCEVCDKAFRDSSSFSRHKRIHTGERPYVCQVCKKAFGALISLKYHSRRHTGERVACGTCGVTYAHYANLRRHMKTHTEEGVKLKAYDAVDERKIVVVNRTVKRAHRGVSHAEQQTEAVLEGVKEEVE